MSPGGSIDGSWPASQQQATSHVRVMFFEINLAEREREISKAAWPVGPSRGRFDVIVVVIYHT